MFIFKKFFIFQGLIHEIKSSNIFYFMNRPRKDNIKLKKNFYSNQTFYTHKRFLFHGTTWNNQ